MSIVQHILKEEYDRLQKLVVIYSKAIDKLPKGSISRKKRNNNVYSYLAYRADDKIKFLYLGKDNSPKVREIAKQIAERKEKEKQLRQVKASLKEIGKFLDE